MPRDLSIIWIQTQRYRLTTFGRNKCPQNRVRINIIFKTNKNGLNWKKLVISIEYKVFL